jgi:L-iditol 2-dehydrogenase
MKVGMYYNNSDVRLEEMDVPSVGDGDLLMEVKACGICGSDIMEWYRIKRAPLVLGHEVTGDIVEVGKDVDGFKVGDRITSTHHVPCYECRDCLKGYHTACETFHGQNNFAPGGFAQYLRISGNSVPKGTMALPEDMSYEQGSFIEPLGTVVRGMREIGVTPGETVLVLGSGLIGLLQIKLLRTLGVGVIVAADVQEYRLDAAVRFGADHVVDAREDLPEFLRQVNGGRLADKVIVSTGALAAAKSGLSCVDKGGTVLFFAVPRPEEQLDIDINAFWRDSKSIKVSYGAAPVDNLQAMDLIKSGRVEVDDMITHQLPLDEIGEGFRLTCDGTASLKVIIEPNAR